MSDTSVAALLSEDQTRLQLPDAWELSVVSLSAIDLRNLDLVKGPRLNKNDPRNQRFVYRDAINKQFLKVWSPAYARTAEFLRALAHGFYDHGLCSALTGVIVDDELECRGYVMREGELIKHEVPDAVLRALLRKSINTQHVYYDLRRCVIKIDGAYSLIDLEGVYLFSELAPYWRARLIGKRTRGCVASPLSYHRALSRLRRLLRSSGDRDYLQREIDRLIGGLPFAVSDQRSGP